MAVLGTDIYEIQNFINDIKKENFNVNENTLSMGIFGYLTDVFSHLTQNNIIVASEYINEMFPTRVKFEKNILDHAMLNNITDINATPATIQVTMCLLEEEVIKNLIDNKLYIDKRCPIYIGDFEFHLEYDIILTHSIINNSSKMYTARYDIQRINSISQISTPYLTAPIRQTIGNNTYIFITCQLRQISYIETHKKIITNNYITNKSFEFEFDNQMATFDIQITDGDNSFYITPLLQGSTAANVNGEYCYYRYINSNSIRVLFDNDSYVPTINTDINITIQTTRGLEGNFEYTDDIITSMTSETYGYTELSVLVKPLSESEFGLDRLSVDELKEMIPREALARGSYTTLKDLNNYFNTISTDDNKLTFIKKSDNQIERLYYSYLLLKDNDNIIVPTNTIPIQLLYKEVLEGEMTNNNSFDSMTESSCIIKPGTRFKLNNKGEFIGWIGSRDTDEDYDDNKDFVYSLPFLMIVNTRPLLYTSYYLNIINKRYQLLITSDQINNRSEIQFIALNCDWKRQFNIDRNIYKLTYQCTQNINIDSDLVITDEDGNIIESKVRSIAKLTGIYGNNFVEGDLINYSKDGNIYEFEFRFRTEDLIDPENRISILDLYEAKRNSDGGLVENFFNSITDVDIYILYEDPNGNNYGQMGLEIFIPDVYEKPITNYTVSNIYSVKGGVEFFVNYTDIISSKTTVTQELIDFEKGDYRQYFNLKSVPCVRASYINDEQKINNFIDIIETKRGYIENTLNVLEDQFGVDFKFYNTYGPSKTFYIDNNGKLLDRVNINLKFEVGLQLNADKSNINNIKNDIKDYIENLNNVESNLHMSNVITPITNKYITDTLNYIEFVSVNSYNTNHQLLERIDIENLDVDTPPEFINIHYTDNEVMGIDIDIVV